MSIPYYLQNEIILLIVDHLLIDKRSYGNNTYNLKRFISNSNELITLSTVSKKYHLLIKNIIKNNLINNKSLHNWLIVNGDNNDTKPNVIKWTDITMYPKLINKQIQINQLMSLIKIEDNEFEYYFNNKLKVENKVTSGDSNGDQFENIVNNLNFGGNKEEFIISDEEIDKFLSNGLSENIKDKTIVNIYGMELGFDNLQSKQFSNGLKSTNHYNIGKLEIYDIGEYLNNEIDSNSLSNNINILNPKELKLYPNNNGGNHVNYEWIFNIPNIESIKIDDTDYIDCKDFNGLLNNNNGLSTSSSKLSSLSVNFIFHDIIKILRDEPSHIDCNPFHENYDTSTIEEMTSYWNLMILSLSNNKSIKCLKIKNFCRKGNECFKVKPRPCTLHPPNKFNPNFCTLGSGTDCFQQRRKKQIKFDTDAINLINDGFKSLFSINSTIEYFKFKNLEFLNQTSLSGLIENKSIKEIQFKNTISYSISNLNDNFNNLLDYLIFDVLNVNKTIKHLTIIHYSEFNIFKLLLINQLNLNLYSVKLSFNQNHVNEILELISSVNTTIKEITLIILYNYEYISNEIQYKSISNSINECNKLSNNPKLIKIKVIQ